MQPPQQWQAAPPPPQFPLQQPPSAQKKGGWATSRPVIGIVALILGLILGAAGKGSSTASTATATATTTATSTVTVTAANAAADKATATVTVTKTNTVTKTAQAQAPAAGATIEDGMSQVGTDVQPGTYKTKVPSDSIACYYARMSGPSDNDIIDNNLAEAGNTVYVTIKSTDKYFDSKGCGTWTKTH